MAISNHHGNIPSARFSKDHLPRSWGQERIFVVHFCQICKMSFYHNSHKGLTGNCFAMGVKKYVLEISDGFL